MVFPFRPLPLSQEVRSGKLPGINPDPPANHTIRAEARCAEARY